MTYRDDNEQRLYGGRAPAEAALEKDQKLADGRPGDAHDQFNVDG